MRKKKEHFISRFSTFCSLSEMKVRQKMLEDAETIAQRIELENVEKQLKEYENEEKRKVSI